MGSRKTAQEQMDVHHFAARVLGLALPPIDSHFSPINRVLSEAEKLHKYHNYEEKPRLTLRPHLGNTSRRSKTEALLVSTLTSRSRRTSIEPSHTVTSLGPLLSFQTAANAVQTMSTRSQKSTKFNHFSLPKGVNPPVKVKTMTTITVLSPTNSRKKTHFRADSEPLYTSKSPQPSPNLHDDSNASGTLASGTEEILCGLYQESALRLQLYTKRSTQHRAQKLRQLHQ